MNRIIYQTVEDRGNPDYVEQHGPFICTNKNAWLGEGYYFWDTNRVFTTDYYSIFYR